MSEMWRLRANTHPGRIRRDSVVHVRCKESSSNYSTTPLQLNPNLNFSAFDSARSDTTATSHDRDKHREQPRGRSFEILGFSFQLILISNDWFLGGARDNKCHDISRHDAPGAGAWPTLQWPAPEPESEPPESPKPTSTAPCILSPVYECEWPQRLSDRWRSDISTKPICSACLSPTATPATTAACLILRQQCCPSDELQFSIQPHSSRRHHASPRIRQPVLSPEQCSSGPSQSSSSASPTG